MELDQVIKERYSVRQYSPKKVEREKLDELLRISQMAPTAANRQPVRVIVVQEEQGLDKVAKAARVYRAPLVLIVCADRDAAWVREFDHKNHLDIDASILTDHMMLKATDLGLGSVWICRFDPEVIRAEFRLPASWEPVNLLALGYPAAESAPSKMHTDRRKLEEYVYYETV